MTTKQQDAQMLYKSNALETLSPGSVVLMLYDGALRFMNQAKQGFEETQFGRRNEIISNNLIKAQKILMELIASLDFSQHERFCEQISTVYRACYNDLKEANINKDPALIDRAYAYIEDIRNTWAQMLENQAKSEADAS